MLHSSRGALAGDGILGLHHVGDHILLTRALFHKVVVEHLRVAVLLASAEVHLFAWRRRSSRLVSLVPFCFEEARRLLAVLLLFYVPTVRMVALNYTTF